jgi:hypothetical protein
MKKALSLHIGLNEFDRNHYGEDGFLKNPENDVRDMMKLAKCAGYEAMPLFTKDATAARVFREIEHAADVLEAGDTFLITYSGHGSKVNDMREKDEDDKTDEIWCLYDRMVLDDELYRCWSAFKRGVRILVISDSCHSGTVARMATTKSRRTELATGSSRLLPEFRAREIVSDNKVLYEGIKFSISRGIDQKVEASVLLLAACQDHQLAGDGRGDNGTFTEQLLRVWNNGAFSGNHREFFNAIASGIPASAGQTPNFFWATEVDSVFENEIPFNGTVRSMSAFQPGDGKVKLEIEVDSERLRGISLDELQEMLESDAAEVLLEIYRKVQEAKEQMSFKRENGGGRTVGHNASNNGRKHRGSAAI